MHFFGWLIKKWQFAALACTCMFFYGCLAYAGHLGAKVVYSHGGGVNPAAWDCNHGPKP